MIKDHNQKQEGGDSSTNLQGQTIVINQGISYADAKEIAIDVYQANFLKLSQVAETTAKARVEEITELFFSKLQKEHPEGIGNAHNPDFQYALFTVQKEYAKTGDKALGDLLVDLLVDRSKQQQRNILQIVLNEALSTAPKLTDSQLAVLAVKFLFGYTQHLSVGNHDLLGQYFDKFIAPLSSKIVKNQAAFQHLEYAGCGSVGTFPNALASILGSTYQGLFLKGFDQKEVVDRSISLGLDQQFFIGCLNDPSKTQVNALNKDGLSKKFEEVGVTEEDRSKISALFELGKMSETEIRDKCIEVRPYMADIFDCWESSSMGRLTLTSVGIAIGHANIKRFAGEFADLAIWIN